MNVKQYILYNPLSGNGRGEQLVRSAKVLQLDRTESELCDLTKIGSYAEFFARLAPDDRVVLCGGDGTVNRFANDTKGLKLPKELYYFACGTGNDLMRDLGLQPGSSLVRLGALLEELPTVTVGGQPRLFVNNVGFGIDGYCCEEGDRQREQHRAKINYTKIAIRGVLGKFRPVGAVVTVDGVPHRYSRVWLAPTMKGRYYGGGMMPAPAQDRADGSHAVSVMVMHGGGRLRTLMIFPGIFKGKHIRHKKMVEVLTGHDILVEFDRPAPLQIDGETVSGVRAYHVRTQA